MEKITAETYREYLVKSIEETEKILSEPLVTNLRIQFLNRMDYLMKELRTFDRASEPVHVTIGDKVVV